MRLVNSSTHVSNCFHCGSPCDVEHLSFDQHDFCCQGCQTVYDILKSNDLCTYYDLDQQPGIKYTINTNNKRFDYLDDSEIIDKLCDFKNDHEVHITFYTPQMHCHSCIWLLEKLPALHSGISRSSVNFIKKTVSVVFETESASLKEVVALLHQLGYEPTIRLEENISKSHKWLDKKTIIQLGVAGFCFGNIMLFSFPEYISGISNVSTAFAQFFGVISLILATILLAVSSSHYFKSSIEAIKFRKININIPISLGIIALYTFSAYEIIAQVGAGYLDSLAGFLFFLLIGRLFQQKTFDQLSFDRDYKSYFPMAVMRIEEDGSESSIPLPKLNVGDRIFIKNEEIIPADGILVSSDSRIDYSFVTGESDPISKVGGEIIYAGGRIKGAGAIISINKTPDESYLTTLWNRNSVNHKKNSLSSLSDRVATYFTWIILGIAFISAGFWATINLGTALKVFTSVLIVACPCALALAIPFAYGNMVRHFAKRKFFLKDAQLIESLTSIDMIVFDKTGTLTELSKEHISFEGRILNSLEQVAIKSLTSLSSHPISIKISERLTGNRLEVSQFLETPGKGIEGFVNGDFIQIGNAEFIQYSEPQPSTNTGTYVSINYKNIGYFITKSRLRTGLTDLIDQITPAYQLAVLSGDSHRDKTLLKTLFPSTAALFFKQSPFDKEQRIAEWRALGHQTMMLGDGLNDAGALKCSNIGIAVSENLAQFTPASDGILHSSHLPQLWGFMHLARLTKRIVYLCFAISFLYNLIGLTFALQGMLSPVLSALLMPISSLTVVIFAIVSTNLVAKKHLPKEQNESIY